MSSSNGRRIGPHLPLGQGLLKAADRATEIGATTVQVFTDNPTAWRRRSQPPKALAEFKARLRQAGIREVDLAIVTNCGEGQVEVGRREPVLWVVGAHHGTADVEILPLALSKPPCMWRDEAIRALTEAGRKYRVQYQSANATALAAAVQAGLALTVLAESALRRGMRVLGEQDGLPRLPNCEIGIIRSSRRPETPIVRALADHIVSSLDNLSVAAAAE